MMKITENIPLSDHTTYRIGGMARYYAEPADENEIVELYRYASVRGGMPIFILGNGSNLLISDKGIDGLVINLSANFTGINWDGTTAVAQGGAPLDSLITASVRMGLLGMEELSGIPGTIGGAAVMNAGAFDTEIAHTLRYARVLRVPSLTIENIAADDMSLGYRTSALKGTGDVLLTAAFEFTPEPTAGQAASARERILARRREKQPLDKPSCGSVFKRPPGNYAGTLIESCGLKGFKIGGAMVSEKHANFIINIGGAKAEDVRGVIRHIRRVVSEETGILLEPEVIFAGQQ